jgi:CubicO group peptidase (beta-lactamase class C family)
MKALYDDPFRAWTEDELLAIGLGQAMHCDPGECWSYAHTNFVILGAALAKAAGKPLAELLEENISDPLGLTGTVSDQTAYIPEPVLHAFDRERGRYEESTYWNPSWTLAEGAVQTSTIADVLKSAAAIGEGMLLTPESHRIQLAPATAEFPPWSEDNYYAYGLMVARGWIVQIPSFSGYAATMAYFPARKFATAIAVTVDETADPDRNYSTDILKDLAAEFVPEAPL